MNNNTEEDVSKDKIHCKYCGRELPKQRLDKWSICSACALLLTLTNNYPPKRITNMNPKCKYRAYDNWCNARQEKVKNSDCEKCIQKKSLSRPSDCLRDKEED